MLAAHVAGDRYAFEELFYRHHRQLHRLAQITSRNPEDAADALQDAMLSAHRSAPSFRHDSAVSGWLYRIVVNACLDRLRRNQAHPTTELEDDACHVGDPAPSVTAVVVERALMRLPVAQHAAVVAVDMQGYSVAEDRAHPRHCRGHREEPLCACQDQAGGCARIVQRGRQAGHGTVTASRPSNPAWWRLACVRAWHDGRGQRWTATRATNRSHSTNSPTSSSPSKRRA